CKCPKCGRDARRETDTMPQWAGSSWYYLRYIDPKNDDTLADREKLDYWLPVDWYNGGMEHVTRHMIYSRFWHKFLYDLGVVPCEEPYAKRTAQGLILGPDGEKMSKSRGNVVDPLDVIDEHGADVLRTYVLFMGDYSMSAPWSDSSVRGCRRFIERVWGMLFMTKGKGVTEKLDVSFNKTVKKVTSDIEQMKFNTAIAAMMTLVNEIYDNGSLTTDELGVFVRLLSPFAPHICEEMWERIGGSGLCSLAPWPTYDESKTKDAVVTIAVQICGKTKDTIQVPAGADQATAVAAAKQSEKIAAMISGKEIVKEIYVKDRIVNIVVR
ncbi:MAG: class I tRNA ligase family protein, partial [Clostridia bacterium]|nr:class I tRNA ligase family protein [Clostridia bacterium]